MRDGIRGLTSLDAPRWKSDAVLADVGSYIPVRHSSTFRCGAYVGSSVSLFAVGHDNATQRYRSQVLSQETHARHATD
jgi:hypothetical protein